MIDGWDVLTLIVIIAAATIFPTIWWTLVFDDARRGPRRNYSVGKYDLADGISWWETAWLAFLWEGFMALLVLTWAAENIPADDFFDGAGTIALIAPFVALVATAPVGLVIALLKPWNAEAENREDEFCRGLEDQRY